MPLENMTTDCSKPINETMTSSAVDPKLRRICKVHLEDISLKLPSTPSKLCVPAKQNDANKITVRRESVRLMNRYPLCMKESPVRKLPKKRKMKRFALDVIKKASEEGPLDTTLPNLGAQLPDLPDVDFVSKNDLFCMP